MTKEELNELLNSPEAEAVGVLGAYIVHKTKTTKDDEIVEGIAEYAEQIAEKIKEIANKTETVTDSDAKKAAIVLLEKIAALTETKWDDLAVTIAKKIIN